MRKWSLFMLSAFTLPAFGATDWIKISSAHFTLYTTYLESEARRTLENLEQTRDFFQQVKAFAAPSPAPLTVVGFRTQREYRPYTRSSFIRAYYAGSDDGEYLVLSDPDFEGKRVAVHEYVHVLVRHSGLSIPIWLNEGLAEVYSGMGPDSGKILVGRMPADRIYTLGSSNWMRLRTLIQVTPDSPEYNEKDRAGIFYAQSCLLTHMLLLGDGYRDKFSTFLERVSASGSTQAALSEVYSKSLADVEQDLRAYFTQSSTPVVSHRAELRRVESGPAMEVTDVEIGLILSNLLATLGRAEDARRQLQQLAADHKDNPEIESALAAVELSGGDPGASLQHYSAILSRGAAGWQTYWGYARALDSIARDRTAEFSALRKVLDLKPDLVDARLLLGQRLYEAGEPAEALAQLKQIGSVDPERALPMYMTMAYAAVRTRQPRDAKEYAEAARRFAHQPEDVARVDAFLHSLETGSAGTTDMRPPSTNDPDRPTLRRQTKKQQ
jgi:tetratricopeptide (TPR) repeat protein